MSAPKWNRKLHRWGAVISAFPVLVILLTGVLLQVKKHWFWVQPPTISGSTSELQIPWERVLEIVASVPEADVKSWEDVDRLDVRPGKGMLKVRCKNRWEVQIDTSTGAVLSSALRRSDLIESLHDGSWFHPFAKLGLFLPTALVLTALWVTGVYLWLLPHVIRRRRKLA